MNTLTPTLRITEIFYSLQGESTNVGLPTIFIRLTGCPLRCTYCDTAYAFHGGKKRELADIFHELAKYSCKTVCVTGGEPLAQPNCLPLMTQLCDLGYQVSIETSGAIDISEIDPRVMIVMDLKTPASGEQDKNLWNNISHLKPTDQIKWVICNLNDYEWAKACILEHKLDGKTQLLFSPSHQQLEPSLLAEWILKDQLPVRFQMQLHKVLWGNEPGR